MKLKTLIRKAKVGALCLIPWRRNSNNSKLKISSNDNTNCAIQIYYHVWCGPGEWREIVKEQVRLMKSSGLLDVAEIVNLTIIGAKSDRAAVTKLFDEKKLRIVYESDDPSCCEWPCLEAMQMSAREGKKFNALYIHAKGSSYTAEEASLKRIKCVRAWRRMMDYWCIEQWRLAVAALNHGYGAYGCHYLKHSSNYIDNPFFAGNFWWATSEDVLKRKILNAMYMADRYHAESWIGTSPLPRYSAFDVPVLLYDVELPEGTYRKSPLTPSNLLYALRHWTHNLRHATFIV